MAKTTGFGSRRNIDLDAIPSAAPIGLPPSQLEATAFQGELIQVELSQLDDNPYNAREFYSNEDIATLAESIQKDSQLVPIIVTPNPKASGRFIAIAGKRRRLAMALLNRQKIQAKVVPAEDAKRLYAISLVENEEREPQSDMDNGFVWARLLQDSVYATQEELAAFVQRDRTEVGRALRFAEMPAALIAVMREKPAKFSARFAGEVWQVFKDLGEEKALEYARRVITEDLTFKDAVRLREQLATAPGATPAKSLVVKSKMSIGKAVIGKVKEWENGRMQVDLPGLTPAEREAVKKAIAEAIRQMRPAS